MRHRWLALGSIILLVMQGGSNVHATERYALLVSIGTYRDPNISNLPPSEDADLIEKVLVKRWHFKPGNVFKLTESQATKHTIMAKLQEIAQRAQPDDAVLFFFSGHGGTTEAAPPYFSLCAWDAKADSAANDITEEELAEWVRSLRTINVTIILDCCFERITIKSPRIRPKAIGFRGNRQKPSPHGFGVPDDRAVVIKACDERELAQQEISPDGETSYGVFTYILAKVLHDISPQTTYKQLIERLQTEVTAYIHQKWPSEQFTQRPRIAGSEQQQNRRLFERNGKSLPPYRVITRVEGDRVELDAGESAGLCRDSRYIVYPPEEESFDESHQLGIIVVTNVTRDTAEARIIERKGQIMPNCRARLVQYPQLNDSTVARCRMHLKAPEPLLTELRDAIKPLEYVELTDTPLQRDWVLEVTRLVDGQLHAVLYESDGRTKVHRVEVTPDGEVKMLLVEARGSTVAELVQQLQPVWLRFYTSRVLLNLRNPNPSFKIELSTDKERYREGDPFKIRFKAERDCYLILIAIDPTGTPTVLYPWHSDQPQKVKGGEEYLLEGPSPGIQWVIKPPIGRECLVAIATLQQVPPNRLELLLQVLGQLREPKSVSTLPPGIKSVTVGIQNLPLSQWNIAIYPFLSEEQAGNTERK